MSNLWEQQVPTYSLPPPAVKAKAGPGLENQIHFSVEMSALAIESCVVRPSSP